MKFDRTNGLKLDKEIKKKTSCHSVSIGRKFQVRSHWILFVFVLDAELPRRSLGSRSRKKKNNKPRRGTNFIDDEYCRVSPAAWYRRPYTSLTPLDIAASYSRHDRIIYQGQFRVTASTVTVQHRSKNANRGISLTAREVGADNVRIPQQPLGSVGSRPTWCEAAGIKTVATDMAWDGDK